MHWTYDEDVARDALRQGDIIRRDKSFDACLADAAPEVVQHEAIRYLIVLTQTCDLLPREDKSGAIICSAKRITLAPVLDLDEIVGSIMAGAQNKDIAAAVQNAIDGNEDGAIYVRSDRAKTELKRALQRIFNNNDDELFYLDPQVDAGLSITGCCELTWTLSLDIRYYQQCLDAKILQLTDEFRARLGWALGKIYARVATSDWPDEELEEKIEKYLGRLGTCMPDKTYEKLKSAVRKELLADENFCLTEQWLARNRAKWPLRRDSLIEIVGAIAAKFMQGDELEEFDAELKGSAALKNLVPN